MDWKAIYKDGTEITEGSVIPGRTRKVMHDGKDTGRNEPLPAAGRHLDRNKLAQFLVYSEDGQVIFELSPKPNERVIYRRRNSYSPAISSSRYCFIVGTNGPQGLNLYRVTPEGVVSPHEPDIELFPEEKI